MGILSELDGPLLLLSSNTDNYMTGSVIEIDGGYATMHIGANR